jgi:hypothetical protein
MNTYTVSFTARKGNSVFRSSVTVASESERAAIALAETKAKNMSPAYRGYAWSPDRVTKKK